MRRIITTLLTTILSITAIACFLLVGIEDTGLTPGQTLLVGPRRSPSARSPSSSMTTRMTPTGRVGANPWREP